MWKLPTQVFKTIFANSGKLREPPAAAARPPDPTRPARADADADAADRRRPPTLTRLTATSTRVPCPPL